MGLGRERSSAPSDCATRLSPALAEGVGRALRNRRERCPALGHVGIRIHLEHAQNRAAARACASRGCSSLRLVPYKSALVRWRLTQLQAAKRQLHRGSGKRLQLRA